MRDRAITSEHATNAIDVITSEQIHARATVAAASLVDAWGHAHPVGTRTMIGRAPASELSVRHPSVSSCHAELTYEDGTWCLSDRGSLNGTFVDGERVTRAILRNGAQVRFGAVQFDFWAPALPVIPRRRKRQTAPIPIARETTLIAPHGVRATLCQFADRGVVAVAGATVELSRRESALLAVLIERRRDAASADLAFVPWHEIADALGFRSVGVDSDNVRELVARVRRKLVAIGLRDVISSRQGVGYRVDAALPADHPSPA